MKAIFCITGLAIQGLTISAQAQTGKPNIVVIMTDQQRADLCGREGFPLEVTPFVDRLAQENVWFNKAYTVMPASSPARCSMFTGRFPSATHVRTNHNIPDISYQQDLVGVLKENGYKTALVGKNHAYLKPADLDFWSEYGHWGKHKKTTPAEKETARFLNQQARGQWLEPSPISLEEQHPTKIVNEEIPAGVQGRSLWPMLTGKAYPKEEFSSMVVQQGFGGADVGLDASLTFEQEGALTSGKIAHFDELNTWTQSGTSRMIRKDDWKLVMNHYGNGELYNLKKDPSEIHNLFGEKKYSEIQTELLTRLLAWELRLQDPLPLPQRRYHFKQNPFNYLHPEH